MGTYKIVSMKIAPSLEPGVTDAWPPAGMFIGVACAGGRAASGKSVKKTDFMLTVILLKLASCQVYQCEMIGPI